MSCGKYARIRSVDVGRKGHHFIKIGITKKVGKRGGRTEKIGGLREYKTRQTRGHKKTSIKDWRIIEGFEK